MRFQAGNKTVQRGFTLMELVIVMTVIAILVSVAVPVYVTYVKRAKEVVLMNDLDEMRRAIDKYTADKEKAPQSLQDLVTGGYLRRVPEDPITKSSETWEIEMETEAPRPGVPAGIANVRSGADGAGTDGRAYKEY
ncbi:MAG TPA: prepilin-type N-terminal cleavage/methylation domain-containing protein [Blastocatellia bacterium]|nr:prepilin-type N-terminal cleavage/methylation domain-containing protein [Blastocatellia bacterium]